MGHFNSHARWRALFSCFSSFLEFDLSKVHFSRKPVPDPPGRPKRLFRSTWPRTFSRKPVPDLSSSFCVCILFDDFVPNARQRRSARSFVQLHLKPSLDSVQRLRSERPQGSPRPLPPDPQTTKREPFARRAFGKKEKNLEVQF